MKKDLLTGFLSGSLVALAFGAQQSTSILLSSFHDLPSFPKTSLIAVVFILFMHLVVWGFLTAIFALIFGWLTKSKKQKEAVVISASLGFATALSVFVFLFGRFASVFHKKTIFMLVSSISILTGIIFGFLFFTAMIYLIKRKRAWAWIKRLVTGLVLVSWLGLGLILAILALDHHLNGLPGLPKKSRLNQKASQKNPNIVLLTIDAQRADHLGLYGYDRKVSPNLDQIAKQGLVFEQMYANAPWTLPSLASMIASRLPTELKISVDNLGLEEVKKNGRLTNQVETLPERLQTLGYQNQAILTNEWLTLSRGFGQGFDGFVNLEKLMPYHYRFHFKNMALTLLLGRIPQATNRLERIYTFFVGPSGPKQFETRAWEINRWALPWLDDFQNNRFFLWLHYIDPHAPYDPGLNYNPNLDEITQGRAAKLRHASAHDPDQIRWREVDKQALVKLYDGDVSLVDAAIGEIWEKLNQLNLMDNTYLIISADHGEEFWDHDGMGHGRTLYEEVIKVPLIIVGPGIKPGRINQKVSLLDLYPTIIDLANGQLPRQVSGRSIKPLMEGRFLPEKEIISEGTGRGTERRAIILGNYKLIHDFFTDESQLYGLVADGQDQADLATFKPAIVQRLKTQLLSMVNQFQKNRQEIFKKPEAAPPLGDVIGY